MNDFNEFKEHAVRSGLGTILAYKLLSETKYHIVCPLTTIPSIAGSKNTIDYSTTSNKSITKVPGKQTVNDVEFNFAWNADTIEVMDEISNQNLDYAIIDLDDGTGWKFTANASYRLADVSPDNVKEGTCQLTISKIEDQASFDLLANFMDTITFESEIPSNVRMAKAEQTSPVTTTISVETNPSDATVVATTDSESIATVTYSSKVLTITAIAKGTTYVYLKATKSEYAGSSRKIYVVVS